jgi:hypothetical protein
MTAQADFEALDQEIQQLKKSALALSDMGNDFPAIKRNAARILSSIKMLEINVSDVVRLSTPDEPETAGPKAS